VYLFVHCTKMWLDRRWRIIRSKQCAPLNTYTRSCVDCYYEIINPLYAELNPNCHFLALLGAHHILHVSGVRVNLRHSGMFSLKIKTRIFRALAILLFHFHWCFPKYHLNLFPPHKFADGGSQPKHVDPGCDVTGFWS